MSAPSRASSRRLWVVTRTYEALALAESGEEAMDVSEDSIRHDDPEVEVAEWREGAFPAGWDERCLVYHDGDEDITVPQAIEIAKRSVG